MKRLFLFVLAVFFIAVVLFCSEQQPQTEYVVVYNVLTNEEKDDYDVFIMDLDGSNKRNLTQNPDVAWSYLCVGDRVLFISDRDTSHRNYFLYEMDTDGSNIRQVSDLRLRDSWMDSRNNGSELIVNVHSSVDTAFYIIDRNGKVLQKINPGLAYFNDPAFSPDGSRIVFRGATKPFKKDTGYVDEIYLMNADGTGLRQLTQYPAADTTAPWYAYHAGPPRWHPTENFISYQSFQNGKYSLYAITPDGSRQWKLTENKLGEGWHDWTPDGKWLAIGVSSLEDPKRYDIAVMNWETKKLNVLTDTTYTYNQGPAFVSKTLP